MFQKFIKKRADLSVQVSSKSELKQYMEKVDKCINESPGTDIVIEAFKGSYVTQNLYLVEKMMDRSSASLRLYVDNIDESIYGHIIARNMLINWLDDNDKTRKVKLLLREGSGFKSSSFYLWMKEYIESGQIEVKTLELFSEYDSFAAIFDEQAIKIKVRGSGKDKMLGNFHDPDTAKEMVALFDQSFDAARAPSNISLMFIRAAIGRKFSSEQKEQISKLAEKINGKIESSDNSAFNVCLEY